MRIQTPKPDCESLTEAIDDGLLRARDADAPEGGIIDV